MEWNSVNAAPFQQRRHITNVNIAANHADRDSLPCWKIFSTVFPNSRYYQCEISDGSTVVGGANN